MLIFTVCAANYLGKAEVLARSLKKHCADAELALVLMERSLPQGCDDVLCLFDHVLLAETLLGPDWPGIMFKYDITEASTAIKPVAFKHFMETFADERSFIYLDPDMMVYAPMTAVEHELERSAILLTPHHLADEKTSQATADNVYRTMCCGIMNLGFIALSRTEEAGHFLDWWWMRCRDYCFIDFARGLFVDQKWIDLAMAIFDTRVLRHEGYNVANWNVSQRPLSVREGVLLAGKDPLVLFHFSGIDKGKDKRIFKRYDRSGLALQLRSEYRQSIDRSSAAHLRWERWSYGRFRSGQPIEADTRLACARNPALLSGCIDPYDLSNEHFLEIGY